MQRSRLNAIPTPRGRQLLRALWSFGVQPIAAEAKLPKSVTPAAVVSVEVATSKHPIRPPHFALPHVAAAAARTTS